MVIWHALNGRGRIFFSRRHGLSFFNSRPDLMIGPVLGREILRSPWLYRHAVKDFLQSLCICASRSLRMTCKRLLSVHDAGIRQDFNLT
jgi:hypothetical protein